MRAIVIIPARIDSMRFPGKMLASDTGRPLIQHVYEQARRATRICSVIVATDDERIAHAVRSFGGTAVMTRADHPNGTSRIAEVAATLKEDIIVNVQGDEPEIDPALIDRGIETLEADRECPVATIAAPFEPGEDPSNPNVVKVVVSARCRALYFSRSLIPFDRDGQAAVAPLKHVGLYIYRRWFLPEYVAMPPTPLEHAEKLEQLRILEHGRPIAVAIARSGHHGIDTPEQYQAFVRRYRARMEKP